MVWGAGGSSCESCHLRKLPSASRCCFLPKLQNLPRSEKRMEVILNAFEEKVEEEISEEEVTFQEVFKGKLAQASFPSSVRAPSAHGQACL